MRRMWLRIERVQETHGVPSPDAAERLTMTRYMLDHALRVAEMDLPDLRGRDQFMTTCTRCHELPDPSQHTNQDWPTVVIRMRQHMVDLLGDSPRQSEIQDIITYLQAVSQ
jgi:cytochrome c2